MPSPTVRHRNVGTTVPEQGASMPHRLPAVVLSLALLLPALARAQSQNIDNYAVFAGQDARLQSAAVVSTGYAGSLGTLKLSSHAGVQKDAVAPTLTLGRGAFVV